MSLKRKDLLSLAPLSADEIQLILETADSFKEVTGREIKKVPALRGTHGRESLLRAQHENPDVVRVGRQAAECGCDQFFPFLQQCRQRRNIARHRSQYRSHAG